MEFEEEKTPKWYAIKVLSAFDNAVKDAILNLRASLGWEDKILQVIIPTEKRVVIKNGKRQEKEEKMFPGHVLALIVLDEDVWYSVNNIEHVSGFLGSSTSPEVIPDEEMERIKKQMNSDVVQHESEFSIGDSVRVVDGPFKNVEGKVSELDPDKGQVLVLVPMFGRDTPVKLDLFQIRGI